MSDIFDIYQRAKDAYDAASFTERDDVLDPFIREMNDGDFDITFGEARALDEEYFGESGGYWACAFGNPKIGVEVNSTYAERTCIFIVTRRGLLTMEMDEIQWNE